MSHGSTVMEKEGDRPGGDGKPAAPLIMPQPGCSPCAKLSERLEKSEKGRAKLRQAMDLVRARLDEANSLQEQLRAARQDLVVARDQSKAAIKRAETAEARAAQEAARADKECQRAEAERKKAREQFLKLRGEQGPREIRIQVAEQEAIMKAERSLAVASAERDCLQKQVSTAVEGLRAASCIGKAAVDICSELSVELQGGGSAGSPDGVVIGCRQGEVDNVDPSPTLGEVDVEVEHLLQLLTAIRGSIGEALGKVRSTKGGERKRKGGEVGEEARKTPRLEEVVEERGGAGILAGGEVEFGIDIESALWGSDGEDVKEADLVGVAEMVQSLEGLLKESKGQDGERERADDMNPAEACATNRTEGRKVEEGEKEVVAVSCGMDEREHARSTMGGRPDRGEEKEDEDEVELRAWLESTPLPRLPSPPPHWGGGGGEDGSGEISLSAWNVEEEEEEEEVEEEVAMGRLLVHGAVPPLSPSEGLRSAQDYAAHCCQQGRAGEVWGLLHHVLCWSLCPPNWVTAVATGLLNHASSSPTAHLHEMVLRAVGTEGGNLEEAMGAVTRAASQALEGGGGAVAREVGLCLQVLAAQLGWEWCYNRCIRELMWPVAVKGASQGALLCILEWIRCTARFGVLRDRVELAGFDAIVHRLRWLGGEEGSFSAPVRQKGEEVVLYLEHLREKGGCRPDKDWTGQRGLCCERGRSMPLCEALARVEQQRALCDSTQVKYSDEEPLLWDISVAFPHLGLHLRFHPVSQRLRLIEIYDVTRLQLRYATSTIGGPTAAATFVRVYSVLGPTFPGHFDCKQGIYTLFYPGVAVKFPIPPKYSDFLSNRDSEAELPLEFPDGTTPVASRIQLYASTAMEGGGGEVGSLSGRALPPPLPPGSVYMEEVQAKLAEGLFFTVGGQKIGFGSSQQDVWSELGRPCSISPKQGDAMLIHSHASSPPLSPPTDTVFSYFRRGIDILFTSRGQSCGVKKFVLHTNCPGAADFTNYIKCNFSIPLPSNSPPITADTKWDQVEECLGSGGRAAIQTRGSGTNPFGPTFVYGYRDIAFEVMRNKQIATVTLFQSSPQ